MRAISGGVVERRQSVPVAGNWGDGATAAGSVGEGLGGRWGWDTTASFRIALRVELAEAGQQFAQIIHHDLVLTNTLNEDVAIIIHSARLKCCKFIHNNVRHYMTISCIFLA